MAAGVHEAAVAMAVALESAGVPYAVGGAIAYGFWGAARGTKDVDLNVFVPSDRVEDAVAVLEAAGLQVDRAVAVRTALERGDARGRFGGVPVDLFFDSIPFHESAARRVVSVELAGSRIRVLSAEDVAVFKLLFFRPKDLIDVERIVALQGDALDRDYVRRWLVDCVGDGDERVRRWDELCSKLPA